MKKTAIILLTISSLSLVAFKGLDNGKYFEIAKNLEIFTNAYKELNHSYVDELDPGKVMRTGMDAMLESLDPFTNYISETDIEGYRYLTEGKYNGIGANSKQMGDFVVITEVYEGSPANKAGIKVGDAITTIDGQSAKGKTTEELQAVLRGFPGTSVDLTVRRVGESKDLKVKLLREEVNLTNVPYYGILSKDIGYINLNVFTRDAGQNVANALKELKKDNPTLKGVVLDLRENGGGLLAEAVNIVNIFVPKNEFVVSTKGKVQEWDRSFKTLNIPVDEEIAVAVLVNKHSASASEIVSGAIQDLDRGVLLGQRTYGKGLVQNTKDLGYNAKIKLTTAKYYIPSGRCIQSVQYKNGEPVDIAVKDRAVFKTRNNREVLDGGGILPDVILPVDTASGVVKALLDQNVVFDYCNTWVAKHPTIDSVETFSFTDWSDFTAFVATKKFDYESNSEKELKALKVQAEKENYLTALQSGIADMDAKIKNEKKNELQQRKARIIHEIEQELVNRYYFQRGKVRKSLKNDPQVDEAVKILNDPARYKSILKKM